VTTVEILGLVAACLLLVLGVWPFVVWRQRRVLSVAGGLPVAVRRANGRWAIGVGQYVGDELLWYRTLSLSPGVARDSTGRTWRSSRPGRGMPAVTWRCGPTRWSPSACFRESSSDSDFQTTG
jgi:hypothetical protein